MCISIRNKTIFSLIIWGALLLSACGAQDGAQLSDNSQMRQDAIEVTKTGVDLVAMDAVVTGGYAMPGTQVKVSVSIANQGTEPAAASQMRYYLSTDSIYDDGDKYLNYDKVSALVSAEASDETANVLLGRRRVIQRRRRRWWR